MINSYQFVYFFFNHDCCYGNKPHILEIHRITSFKTEKINLTAIRDNESTYTTA